MFRPLLLTAIISITVTSSPVSANNDWVAAVLDHPSLRVQHSAIEKQQWKILELEAKKGFDFDIRSSAHLPLAEHFDNSFSRVAKYDPYLDLVFSASQTVYDFGEADALIDAERALQSKARLAFANGFEQQTHGLFSLVIQHQKAQNTMTIVNAAQADIGLVEDNLVRRFEAGLGTIADIRRTQLSQIDLETQVTQLFNKMNAVEHIISSDYGLEVGSLVHTWNNIEPQLQLTTHIDPLSLRSSAISQGSQTSMRHQRSSIAAQKKPKLIVDVNTTLYDVTRSMSNYRVAGEFRLTFPVFDSGYRSAKMASISHAIAVEQQALEQVVQQKTLDLKASKRQLEDLELRQQEAMKKRNNLSLQLNNMKLALGKTTNDHAGLANLYTQITSVQIDLISISSDMQQLLLDRVLLSEQIIQQFNVTSEQLP
jgi:outer membrane protein TolC